MALFDAGSLAFQGTTVTTTATQVFSTSPGGTALTSPQGLVVQNLGTATVYFGGSQVTASATAPTLAPGQYLYISGSAQTMWAITASGSATVQAGLASVAAVV